jgi:hypothetical protein
MVVAGGGEDTVGTVYAIGASSDGASAKGAMSVTPAGGETIRAQVACVNAIGAPGSGGLGVVGGVFDDPVTELASTLYVTVLDVGPFGPSAGAPDAVKFTIVPGPFLGCSLGAVGFTTFLVRGNFVVSVTS